MKGLKSKKNISAARICAAIIAGIAGFMGMEHGLFEILQGNISTDSLIINAIGPEQSYVEQGSERAFSIIPNFLVTGVLAMSVGAAMIVWAFLFFRKKSGSRTLILLSVVLFLVGGGFAPPIYTAIAIFLTFKADRPSVWWDKNLSLKTKKFFSVLQPWILFCFVALSLFVLELAVFGYPFLSTMSLEELYLITSITGWITFFGLGPLLIISTMIRDVNIYQPGTELK